MEGNTLVLDRCANCSCSSSWVRHEDNAALQAALDAAIAEKKPLFIPAGRYRLTNGLWIRQASVRLREQIGFTLCFDISETNTAVLDCRGRELLFVTSNDSHTGFLELASTPAGQPPQNFRSGRLRTQMKFEMFRDHAEAPNTCFLRISTFAYGFEAIYLHGSTAPAELLISRVNSIVPGLEKNIRKTCIFTAARL